MGVKRRNAEQQNNEKKRGRERLESGMSALTGAVGHKDVVFLCNNRA